MNCWNKKIGLQKENLPSRRYPILFMLAEYLRTLFIVFPFFFAFILLEYFITNHKKRNVYNVKDLVASSTFGIGTILMAPMIKAIVTTSLFFLAYEFFNPLTNGVRNTSSAMSRFNGNGTLGLPAFYWMTLFTIGSIA